VQLADRGLQGDPEENAYINANFVDSPLKEGDGKIIASQGPLETTFVDFWRMISEQNVTLVVSTCKLIEKMRPKCHQFWPNFPDNSNQSDADYAQQLAAVGISVTALEPVQLTRYLFVRRFKLSD
jgi:protein tyrosine phosphatase